MKKSSKVSKKDPFKQIRFRNILLARAPKEWDIPTLLTSIAEIKENYIRSVIIPTNTKSKNKMLMEAPNSISFGYLDIEGSNPGCAGKETAIALINYLLHRNEEADRQVAVAVIFYTGPDDTREQLIIQTRKIKPSCFYIPKCDTPKDIWKGIDAVVSSIIVDPLAFQCTLPLATSVNSIYTYIKSNLEGYSI